MVGIFRIVGGWVCSGGCGMLSGVVVGRLSRVVVIVPPLILVRCGMIVLAVLCLLGLGPTSSHTCSSIHRLALFPRILVFCFFAASHRNLGNLSHVACRLCGSGCSYGVVVGECFVAVTFSRGCVRNVALTDIRARRVWYCSTASCGWPFTAIPHICVIVGWCLAHWRMFV